MTDAELNEVLSKLEDVMGILKNYPNLLDPDGEASIVDRVRDVYWALVPADEE